MVQEVNPKDEQSTVSSPGQEPPQDAATGAAAQQKGSDAEWRKEFPYPWDEDDVVTRRDTLRFLVAGTGALFLGTGR